MSSDSQEIASLQSQIRASYSAGGRGIGGGFFSNFSYGPPPSAQDQIRQALVANGCSIPQSGSGGGYKTICVRTCDGYYFPIQDNTSSRSFANDAATCQAMYGGASTNVQLFAMGSGSDDVADATPVDGGKSYSGQPYAFAYRKSYDAACVGQLQAGIELMASQAPATVAVATVTAVPGSALPIPLVGPQGPVPPTPKLRPDRYEDPETLANAAGGLTPDPTLMASQTDFRCGRRPRRGRRLLQPHSRSAGGGTRADGERTDSGNKRAVAAASPHTSRDPRFKCCFHEEGRTR